MYTKYVTSMNGGSRLGFVAHSFSIPKGKAVIVTRDGALLVDREEIALNPAPKHRRMFF